MSLLGMNIDKATKFYLNSPDYLRMKSQLQSDPGSGTIANYWVGKIEPKIYLEFMKKKRYQLNVQQRWHIYLAVIEDLGLDFDKELDELKKSFLGGVAMWAAMRSSKLRNNEMTFENAKRNPNFPTNELRNYAYDNHPTLYPNDSDFTNFGKYLQKWHEATNLDELRAAESKFASFLNA